MSRLIVAFSMSVFIVGLPPVRLLAQTTRPATEPLPAPIEQLRKEIVGLRPIEVRQAIKRQFGQPSSDAGSGIMIPQWKIGGGTLTFHPLRGPIFTTPAGDVHWLLQTRNPARLTVFCQYEMVTPSDPSDRRPRYWIGDVYLASDLTYRFVDGGTNLHDRGDQSRNFFIRHPRGHFEVQWTDGIKDDTPLESIGDREIAHMVFHAEPSSASFRCRLASSAADRSLSLLSAEGAVSFQLTRGWRNFWPVPPADDAELERLRSAPP